MATKELPLEELDCLAHGHVAYEVRMLVGQASALHAKYGRATPAGFKNPREDALLEAALVHLRLLDEFLRSVASGSAHAKHWVRGFRPEPEDWLGQDVRERINRQVAHLSRRREKHVEWKLSDRAYDCCAQMGRFVGEVEKRNPKRAKAFAAVRESVEDGLRRLAP